MLSKFGCSCRWLCFVVWALPFANVLFAQSVKEPADILRSFVPEGCYVKGQFTQEKAIKELSFPLVSEGDFLFDCKHGLIWQSIKPIPEMVIYPLLEQPRQVDASGNLKILDGRVQREIGLLLNRLMGGDTHYILQSFDMSGSESLLTLQPKARPLNRFLQRIELSESEDNIKTITLRQSEQEYTQIAVVQREYVSELNRKKCVKLLIGNDAACLALYP